MSRKKFLLRRPPVQRQHPVQIPGNPPAVFITLPQQEQRPGIVALRRLLKPGRRFFLIFLHRDAVVIEKAQVALGRRVALLRRRGIQLRRAALVLRNAEAHFTAQAKGALGRRKSGVRGLPVQLRGAARVLLHADSPLIAQAQIQLRAGAAALSGPGKPVRGLFFILRHAVRALRVADGQPLLGLRASVLRRVHQAVQILLPLVQGIRGLL